MTDTQVAVGIDIGGTNTVFGLVGRNGNLPAKGQIPTTGFPQIEDFIAALVSGIRNLPEFHEYGIQGVGIGAPNGNFYRGTIEHAPNLDWKGIVPIADLLRAELNVPVYVTNDANAAALGEMIYGAAIGMRDFAVITLGTGLGSGFVSNGSMISGHDGFAGELGHVTALKREDRICGCGDRDCLETYVSATGLVRTAQIRLEASDQPSLLRDLAPNDLSAKSIADAAAKGDQFALDIFDETGEILGFALANTTAITSPEAYIFSGGMALAGDLILEPTRKYMERFIPPFYKGKVKLLLSAIHDKNPAILGGAALFWKEYRARGNPGP